MSRIRQEAVYSNNLEIYNKTCRFQFFRHFTWFKFQHVCLSGLHGGFLSQRVCDIHNFYGIQVRFTFYPVVRIFNNFVTNITLKAIELEGTGADRIISHPVNPVLLKRGGRDHPGAGTISE